MQEFLSDETSKDTWPYAAVETGVISHRDWCHQLSDWKSSRREEATGNAVLVATRQVRA